MKKWLLVHQDRFFRAPKLIDISKIVKIMVAEHVNSIFIDVDESRLFGLQTYVVKKNKDKKSYLYLQQIYEGECNGF